MIPMTNHPAIDESCKGYALIELGSETLLDGTNHAPLVIPAMTNGSIKPAIERTHIGVVKDDFTSRGQEGKPRLYFLHCMLIDMAAVDKQHVDGWLNASL